MKSYLIKINSSLFDKFPYTKNYQTLMTKRSLETDKGKSEASHPKPVFVLESMSTMRLMKPSQFQNLEHMAPHPLVLLMPS